MSTDVEPTGQPTPRTFHLGEILSITTGRFVSLGGFSAVHELLDFMTGDTLYTHQLPRACQECAPALLAQHPQLADVAVPETFDGDGHVKWWLDRQVERFGAELPVRPLAVGDHTRIDPLIELKMLRPGMDVLVVEVPGGDAA